ncbi:MAG: MOSC domain-containing protein [Dehalococcoidia bacterium]
MQGEVVSVNSSPTGGIGKDPMPEIRLIAGHGVEGDFHAGATVRHRSRAAKTPELPNRRQVHLIHSELFDEMAALGIDVQPGRMGENITTRGLSILELTVGARLHIGESVVVEITGLRTPCTQLNSIDERLLQQVARKLEDGSIMRKAGIMGVVVEGGVVRAGDAIRVETREGVGVRLEPV